MSSKDEQPCSSTIHLPGQTVEVSGQYGVVNRSGQFLGREVTCVRGEPFPPTRGLPEYGFRLKDATRH